METTLLHRIAELRDTLAALLPILRRSDQRDWAARIEAPVARLDGREARAAARDLLALYETPDAFDDLVLTHGGVAYKATDAAWREALRYASLRSAFYRNALAVWQAAGGERPDVPARAERPLKLADWGGGSEIWLVGARFCARYDCGSHMSRWREDEISPAEAEQGALGPKHFLWMVIALQARLQALGIDPYAGSASPLPDPV